MTALHFYPGDIGIAQSLDEIASRLSGLTLPPSQPEHPRTALELHSLEDAARELGGELADLLVARGLLLAHQDAALLKEATAEGRKGLLEKPGVSRVKNVGWRPVSVRLAHGLILRLETPYLRPSRKGLVGRPRGTGKRREGGVGVYPVLEHLGILDRVTPMTRSDIAQQVILTSSYVEAQQQLQRRGLKLDRDTLVNIAVDTGRRALRLRDEALRRAKENPLSADSPLAGKRLRISVDGGRARIRHTFFGRRKKKNGRRPFALAWQEPRLITIDVLDEEGEMDRSWRPIYEVSLGNADEVFDLLVGTLRLIGAHLAAEIVFVSDGALWIWDRLEALIQAAELPPERVHAVLDYYHATEHIADALKACKSLERAQRATLIEELSRLLLEPGGPEQVIERLTKLARGRRGKAVNKEIRYLRKRLTNMRYAELRAAKIPLGSGVVESAVRRVLNLRFKSASTCWREDHLEPLLYLRAILKSDRWDDFMTGLLTQQHGLQLDCDNPLPSSRAKRATS